MDEGLEWVKLGGKRGVWWVVGGVGQIGTGLGQAGTMSQGQGEAAWDRTGHTPIGVSQLSQPRVRQRVYFSGNAYSVGSWGCKG